MDEHREQQIRNLLQNPVFGITDCSEESLHLYDLALTHSSFISAPKKNDEFLRLSFLGNYVIDFVIPEYVYRNYPDLQPGGMKAYTEITRNRKLSKLSTSHTTGIDDVLRHGSGTSVTDAMKADAFEALIAAVYLHRGIEKAGEIVTRIFADEIQKVDSLTPELTKSWKSRLNECVQKRMKIVPVYTYEKTGSDNEAVWTATVCVQGEEWGYGEGRRKVGLNSASDNAAKDAFEKHCAGESGTT